MGDTPRRESLFGRFLARYERVMGWPTGKKVLFLTGLALGVHLFATLGLKTTVSHGNVGGLFHIAPLERVRQIWLGWLIPFFLICLWRTRSGREERWLAHALIWLYGLTMLLLLHAWGQITTAYFYVAPLLTLFAAVAFDERIGWATYAQATFLVFGAAAVDTLGLLPYSPAFIDRGIDAHPRVIYYVPVMCVSWGGFSFVFLLIQATTEIRARQRRALASTYEDLAQAKDALVRSETLSLVAGVGAAAAHELGNPLASSGALLQALREDLPPSLRGKAAPLIDRILAREREIAQVVARLQKETEEITREEKLEKKPVAGASGGTGANEGPGSPRGAFAGRYQKYAEWPLPRKVLFGSAVSVPPLIFLTSVVAYFWIAGIGKELLNLYPLVWLLGGYTLWLALCALVAWIFTRRTEESRVPAYFFLVGVLFLCFGLLRLFGTVSSAVFAIFPGLLTYHSIFFDTRVGWTGFFAAITGMFFLAWGDLSGAWTYAPLFYQRRIDDQLLPVFYFSLLLTVWTSFTWVFVQVQLAERLRLAKQREIEEATARLTTMKEELAHAEAKAAAGKVVMDLIPRLLTPLTRNEPDLKELEREFAAAPGEISKDDLEAVGRILRAEARAAAMVGRLEELPKPGTGPVLS